MNYAIISSLLAVLVLGTPVIFADSEKIDFALSLEKTLGHLWALEQNLDDGNAELALIHATHPIAELYESIKPQLVVADPALDALVYEALLELQSRATTDVSRDEAQQEIDNTKELVALARYVVVGDAQSNDVNTKLVLIKMLLETSVAEYREAVADGIIKEMAEFQDGSAFVWRSQEIFKGIKTGIDSNATQEIDELYGNLWDAYDTTADPALVATLVNGITHEINEIPGVEDDKTDLLEYVENIRKLLQETKTEYEQGNVDLAQSLATKAYLDNYEFLEGPLKEMGKIELMEQVEIMLREELRGMIRDGEPSSAVNAKVDAILEKMDTIATIVPEFGTIAMLILAVAITSIIAITAKSRIQLRV